MNDQQQGIREQQKQSWNKFSGGWKKWDRINMDFINPPGQAIIAAIRPGDGDTILDIASGTGEPGLTIARMLNDGRVMLTDLSPDMLAIAEEHAAAKGIRNVETRVCDVCELPFADRSFDAISCRFGFMFFPDMQLAADEMFRVLKPGSRIATAVWNGPDKNFWITVMMSTIGKNMELAAPLPGAPGMFRCAQPGLMKSIFEKAGFSNITEQEVPVKMRSGNAGTYWDMMTEVGAPIVAALSKADEKTIQKIKEQVFAQITARYGNTDLALEGSAKIIAAEKS